MESKPPDAQFADGAAHMQRGEFEEARVLLRRLTQSHPAHAAAWKALGVAENKLGHAEAAQQCLLESLRLDPSDADAWSSLGGVYIALGRDAQALEAFEGALKQDATDTYALLNVLTLSARVADLDLAMRRHAGAVDVGRRRCQAQIAAAANLPWCWYDLAQIHFLSGESSEFRMALRQAIAASSGWQVDSARNTYMRLAGSEALGAAADSALAEFARLVPKRPPSGD